MSFTLAEVVPWGRSFDEYVAMFDLTARELDSRVLGCGDGPAAFNAELTRRGGHGVSVDPLYRFTTAAIRSRLEATFETVLAQTRANATEFTWRDIHSVAELGRVRRAAMDSFLADYAAGGRAGRYVGGELPHLPLKDGAFELALCSHLLFLYSEPLSAAFHVAAIRELRRVAREVRIFPLLELGARPSRHLGSVIADLTAAGYAVQVRRVPYEFQRGGYEMLVVR